MTQEESEENSMLSFRAKIRSKSWKETVRVCFDVERM